MSNMLEVEERTSHEKVLADGPSNPMSQHAYQGFATRQSRSGSGSGIFVGVIAVALVLGLGSISGLWVLRSIHRLNLQVARLNRQAEQLNHRLQGAELQVKALDQKASQPAADAQTLASQGDQTKAPQAAAAPVQTPAQAPLQAPAKTVVPPMQAESPASAAPAADQSASVKQAANKTQSPADRHEEKLEALQHSLAQIAETRRAPSGLVMTLGEKSIRFDSGKSDIAPQYRAVINRIAGVLKPLKGYSFYVYGYTDDTGTKDFDMTISARRARSVRDALVKAGVDPSMVSTKGFGKSKPLVRGTTPKARAANRRMEIGIVDSTQTAAAQPIASKVPASR